MTNRPILLGAFGAWLFASPAALAGQADCDAIAKSMLAVAEQPSVRQSLTPDGPNSILLKDALYVQQAGAKTWVKMPIDATARRMMVEEGLKSLPLGDCRAAEAQTLNGEELDVYDYTQPNPLQPGAVSATRLLIGRSDGLPRRLDLGAGAAMTFEYGDFQAPAH